MYYVSVSRCTPKVTMLRIDQSLCFVEAWPAAVYGTIRQTRSGLQGDT